MTCVLHRIRREKRFRILLFSFRLVRSLQYIRTGVLVRYDGCMSVRTQSNLFFRQVKNASPHDRTERVLSFE